MRCSALTRAVLVLGAIWIIDGALQFQRVHFTSDFADDLAGNAMAQPRVVSMLALHASSLLGSHIALWNGLFALFEIALGAAMLVQKTRRAAVVVSIPWALAVWVMGEGFGGVATGFSAPAYGFPGAAFVYATIAVIALSGDGPEGESRASTVGRVTWSALWLAGAVAQAIPMITPGFKFLADGNELADGEPAWLAHIDTAVSGYAFRHGATATVLLTSVALGLAILPWIAPRSRSALVAIVAVLVLFAVCGENLGGILTGSAYDVGTMPLLGLVLVTFWSAPQRAHRAAQPVGALVPG